MTTTEPLVLRSSRRKWVGVLVLGIVTTVLSAMMIPDREGAFPWFATGFFLLVSFTAATVVRRPLELRVDDSGFTYGRLLRSPEHIAWSECDGFRSTFLGGPNVQFLWRGEDRGARSHTLPDTFGVRAKELAVLLQERRDAAVGTA